MPLHVLVVGAGLAGLSTAIAFVHHGHKVTVFERRESPKSQQDQESGSGIQLQPNTSPIFEKWGILDGLRKVAHDNEMACMRSFDGGDIAHVDFRVRGYAWYGLRGVVKQYFLETARERGVEVRENAKVVEVDLLRPGVVLEDGTRVEGDVLVGADGTWSRVRQTMFPAYRPKTLEIAVFQIVLPLSLVESDPLLRTLYDGPHNVITCSPGHSTFSSPAPWQRTFDMQFIDHEYTFAEDPNPQVHSERIYNLSWLRQRWSDNGAAVCKAIDSVSSAFKWRLTVNSGVPAWSRGNVILIGDAVHGMTPFSGQGSAMGIEDADTLSSLLANASAGDDLASKLKTFERIRRPRVEKVQLLADIFGEAWGAREPKLVETRNWRWRHGFQGYSEAKADARAPVGDMAFFKWLDTWRAEKAIEEEMKQAHTTQAKL